MLLTHIFTFCTVISPILPEVEQKVYINKICFDPNIDDVVRNLFNVNPEKNDKNLKTKIEKIEIP